MEASAPLDTTPNTDKSSAIVSIKGKEPEGCHGHHEEATEATDTCVICLSPITERAVTVPCNHLVFDFLCLVHWLQQQPNCPLCKAVISAVEYDWRSPTDYKTYRVPQPIAPTAASQRTTQQRSSRGRGRGSGRARGGARDVHRTASADQALARRRQVYALHAYSAHVGTNRRSEYAHFTASTLSSSPALQNRARIFLRRELQVFSFLSTRQRLEFVLEYIVAMLKSMEIKGADGAMVRLVGEMVGKEDAGLLCHELEAWLRSPFGRLEDWDAGVHRTKQVSYKFQVKKDFKPELEVISLKKKKVSYKASKIGRNIFVTHPDHPDNEEKQVIKVI
ncbi:hypothetical protein MBLNU457_1597t1 [Dothideomycetes sp. NU457]